MASGGVAPLSPSWLASYGSKPPASIETTLVGQSDASRKLHLSGARGSFLSISEGSRCNVVFSGRLETSGAASGADVVRDAYLRDGETGLRGLRGSFVVLVHDVERDHFIAARDALGYHPLFFAEQDGCVLLAPSQEQLLAGGASAEVDRAVAAGWILRQSLDPRDNFFTKIRRLLPGHRLRVSGSGLGVQRYWSLSTAEKPDATDFALVHREFDDILRRSVARCLDLGPAGIFLSGGFDSTTIAALATEVSRERGLPSPLALSLKFPDSQSDESTVQRAVAEELGLPQILVSFDEAFGTEGGLVKTLRLTAEVATPPGAPWTSAYDYLSSEALAHGCAVILNGEWGEWLFAEREIAADLLRGLDLAALYTLYQSERRYYRSPWWRIARTLIWTYGLRMLIRETAASALLGLGARNAIERRRTRRLLQSIPEWIAPDPALRVKFAGHWASTLPEPGWRDFHRRAHRGALDSRATAVWMDDCHDHARRFGIEALEPFHDRDFLEFLFSIPPEHLFSGGRVKALLQESARSRIPGSAPSLGIARNEGVFEWMLVREGGQGLELVDGFPVLGDLEIVAPNAPVKALRSGDFSEGVEYHAAWRALALEAWLQSRLRP